MNPDLPLDRERLVTTMVAVLDRLHGAPARFAWRLVGTGAALLHGVDLPAGDVDILVRERQAVDAFAEAMAPFPCRQPPVLLGGARQYFANYDVGGVEVGISTVEMDSDTDHSETVGRGPWIHYALLPCGPYSVPTVALELRLVTEFLRHRPDRYRPILAFLQSNGCDRPFILRAMAAAGLPPDLQNEAAATLGEARFRALPTVNGDVP